jgi:hypothetical protein
LDILAHTTQDGVQVGGPAGENGFDVAYQANYGELAVALAFVVEANWGPVLRRPFEALRARWTADKLAPVA